MARSIQRIPIILAELQTFWERHPDLRLGQVFYMIVDGDFFYMEDERILENLVKNRDVECHLCAPENKKAGK